MAEARKKFWKQILLFNRGMFVAAGITASGCAVLFGLGVFSAFFNAILLLIIAVTIWFSVGSLLFSYWIYDVSDLYRFNWLKCYLLPCKTVFNIYSGYSDAGHLLNEFFTDKTITHVDFFDKKVSVTGSIKKAQELSVPLNSTHATPGNLGTDEKADIILFMQSLHELRTKELKTAMLRECRHHMQSGGRIIITEHLCNLQNFLIYGPGAFHFFGKVHWKNVIDSSGLSIETQFNITPFIKTYILAAK